MCWFGKFLNHEGYSVLRIGLNQKRNSFPPFCRESDLRKNRELAQLKKETRRNESKIKSLETEKRIKENILKRKQEEVANLRRNQRKISTLGRNKEKFNAKSVKVKWTNIEKKITKVSARYHYVCSTYPP